MKRPSLFRISACVLVLGDLAFLFGGLLSGASHGSEADAVLSSMRSVQFDLLGATVSWGGMYRGYGLSFFVFVLFSAVVSWRLGGMSAKEREAEAPIAWGLFITYAGIAVLTWIYFCFAARSVFTVSAVLLGASCLQKPRA